jgi:hypothetical protein
VSSAATKARFRDATDRLTLRVTPTIAELVERMGLTSQFFFRWRLPNDRRVPTPGWEAHVAAAAREAAERYRLQAEKLEAVASELEV